MKQFQKAFFAFIVTKLIKSKVNNKFECIIEEVSDNFLHLFNLEFEETINNNLFSILPQFPYNDWVVQLNEINGSNSIELKFKVKNVQYQIYSYKIFDNSSIVSMIIPDLVNEEFLNKENDFDFIYDKYFKNFPFNVFVFDENGTFLKANHRFCQTIGYHSDELIGKNLYDIKLVLPCDYKQMEIKKNPYSKKKYSDTIKFKRKNGTNLYFEISSIIHVNLLNICFLNDITSKTIKNIIDRTIIKFIDFSMTSNSKELMQKFLDEFEMLTESKIGFFHFVSNDQKGLSLQTWSTNTLKNMCNAKGENSHYPIDEAGVWVDCIRLKRPVIHNDYENICHKKGMPEGHAKVIRELVIPIFRHGLVVAIVGVGNKENLYTMRDVKIGTKFADYAWETIKRKINEEQLQKSEKQYSNFIQLSREAIAKYEFITPLSIFMSREEQKHFIEENLILTECNEVFLRMHGFHNPKEVYNHKLADIYSKKTVENKISTLLEKNYFWQNLELEEELKDGNILYSISNLSSVLESDLVRSIWISKIDISEKKRAEKEKQHIQRMESLGILASGLAHDFNNILSGILGNIELLKLDITNLELQNRSLQNVEKAVSRGKDITTQLMNYSRKSEPIIKVESIANLIDSAVKIALPGSKSKCLVKIEDKLPNVRVDVGQIHQVFTNLLINADQSMKDGGHIFIKASKIKQENSINMAQGNYIQIIIKDEGCGIPLEIQDKIFSPFVSTKKQGLGLGLAISQALIKNHKGHIEFKSEIKSGTEFKIYIPCSNDAKTEEDIYIEPRNLKKGNILLMDDDESILLVFKRFLEQLGQIVAITTNSRETIECYCKSIEGGKKFDLVILDLIMPGDLGGANVLKSLLDLDPKVLAVLCTGSLNEPEFLEYERFGFKDALSKPFSFQDIRKLLIKLIPE